MEKEKEGGRSRTNQCVTDTALSIFSRTRRQRVVMVNDGVGINYDDDDVYVYNNGQVARRRQRS